MSAPRRPAFFPALAILLLAGLTSACGVKGDLERPTAAAADPAVTAAAQPGADPAPDEYARKNVFIEQSRVQSGANVRNIIPTMPPKEWEKKKVEQQEQKARAADPRKPNPNDRPFILDGLL
ncbi:MAG TPA: lipoprotein [Xanthobacteraceae bacterium]|nr:lipoprotein [Xanthobacteraceae bacterium]